MREPKSNGMIGRWRVMSRPEHRHINRGAGAIKSCKKGGLVGVDGRRMNRRCRDRSQMVATQGEKSGDGDETWWEEARERTTGDQTYAIYLGKKTIRNGPTVVYRGLPSKNSGTPLVSLPSVAELGRFSRPHLILHLAGDTAFGEL